MKPNALVPWLLAVIFAGGSAYLYTVNSRQGAELATLRPQVQQAQDMRAELDTARATVEQQTAELTNLQKNSQEVLRLRGEVKQLRDDKQLLNKQLMASQSANTRAEQQAAELRDANQQLQAQQAQTNAAPAAAQAVLTPDQQRDLCINQLHQIDDAIQKWQKDNNKPDSAPVTQQDLLPYLPGGVFPKCPSGGTYTLGTASEIPICSIPGHALPQ
jgi:hypothetical protein